MLSVAKLPNRGKDSTRKRHHFFFCNLSYMPSYPPPGFHATNTNPLCDSGGHLSHSFELEAKTKGMFHGSPAVVTFRVPTKSALQVKYPINNGYGCIRVT